MTTTTQDTEITLGTGRMLALFFALVFVCAVFFGVGFSLGRKAASGQDHVFSAQAASPSSTNRPSAGKNDSSQQQSSNFSFYKAVEQKNADSQLAPQNASGQTAPAHAPGDNPSESAASPSGTEAGAGAYFVQVAAVSRQEDAEALVESLKKKQYPAFTTNNSTSDKFFHVQVGPFSDIKDAESMRGRLVGDGYNPIVKK